MLITAGYLSYMNNNRDLKNSLLDSSSIADSEEMASIGDAKLVSANIAENTNEINNTNEIEEKTQNSNIIENDANAISNTSENSVNIIDGTIETNSDSTDDGDEYFTSSRLERETMYSQRIENYQDILNKCFDNNYKILPKKYNYLTPYFWYDDEHKYLIRHLVGHVRPWQIKEDINTDLIPDLKTFWYYAKMTPFYKELTSKAATGIAAQKLLLTARVEAICYKEHFKKAQERSNNEHSDIFVQR